MGKYSNVNVSSLKANANSLLSSLENRSKNFDDITRDLKNKSYFKNIESTDRASKELDKIVSSNDIDGSINKIKKELKKIIKGLDYIEKYQKYEKEYRKAQITTESLKADVNSAVDNVSVGIAKAAEEKVKLQMEEAERNADNALI